MVLLATLVMLLVERVSRCVLCRYCTKREPTRLSELGWVVLQSGIRWVPLHAILVECNLITCQQSAWDPVLPR